MSLASGCSVALIDGRAVILDARADRYRLVVGRKARALLALARNIPVEDDAALDALCAEGALVPPLDKSIATASSIDPQRSAIEMPQSEGQAVSLASVGRALTAAMARLKIAGLHGALQWAAAIQLATRTSPAPCAVALAQSYDRARGRLPASRVCLRDSLALYASLCRHGVVCNLVLGVRLDPFGAHAWVQSEDVVLSDTLWSVRPMRPILVL